METEIPRLQARYPNAHVAAILDGVDGAAVIHMFSLPNGSPLVADHVIIFVDDRWPPVLVVFFNKGCSIGGKVIPRGAVRGFISGRSFPDHGRYQDVAA